jgi:hypothetical protein
MDEKALVRPSSELLKRRLKRLSETYAAPVSSFGLEAKVAWNLAGAGGPEEDDIRKTFFRVPQEPVILSWWDALQRWPVHLPLMLEIASLLNGQRVHARQGEMVSYRGAGSAHLLYEGLEFSSSWLQDVAGVDTLPGDPVNKACYRFARIVAAHPFSDANGRFARAALQAGLARAGLVRAPCLALGPLFARRGAEVRGALRELSQSSDWESFFKRMADILEYAVTTVEEVQEPSRRRLSRRVRGPVDVRP